MAKALTIYKNRRFETDTFTTRDGETRFTVEAWKGRAKNSYAYTSFRTALHRADWIVGEQARADVDEKFKAEQKAQKAAWLADMKAEMVVGAVLYTSWGYDQTNVEFFEVIERKGASVTVREILKRSVEGSEGFMCDRVTPSTGPERFVGETITKRITAYGVKISDCQQATPVTPGREYSRSWYA